MASADWAEAGIVGQTVGPYRIDALIGRGGMGEVYRGWDERLERAVALKLPLAPATDHLARRRFLSEARSACRVNHPNVATVYDVVEDRDRVFLVMEYIEGQCLDAALRSSPRDPRRMGRLALEIAEALGAIHEAGLVHHDVKPGNVMLTAGDHVKVMDFGLATRQRMQVDALSSGDDSTITFAVAGTVAYMSPEQLRGVPLDSRSDIFSYGALLYEMACGEHPFQRGTVAETISAILNDPPRGGSVPVKAPGTGPLRSIALRCLAKQPDARYANVRALIRDLQAVLASPIAYEGLRARRRGAASVAILGALALAGVAAYVATRQPRSPLPGLPAEGPPALLVLPFQAVSQDDGAVVEASALASLLRVEMARSSGLRIVGSTRTGELLGTAAASPSVPWSLERALGIVRATSARFLVAGTYHRADGVIVASVELQDVLEPDAVMGLEARGASLAEVAERLGQQIQGRVAAAAPPSASAQIESIADRALVAAERGRQAEERGRLGQAEGFYREAVVEDSNFLRARVEAARLLYEAGYVTRAREAVASAAEEARRSSRPPPRRLLLDLELLRHRVESDREGEERVVQQLLESFGEDPDVWADAAESFKIANRVDQALAAIDEALRRAPRQPAYLLQQAELFSRAGRYDEAEAALAVVNEIDARLPGRPFRARALSQRGYLELMRRNYEDSREAFRQAADLFGALGQPLRVASAYRNVASTYLLEGKPAQALPAYERATREYAEAGNVRQEATCLDNAGAAYLQLGRHDRAEPLLRRAVERARATGTDLVISPLSNLASVLNQVGRSREALQVAEEARERAHVGGDVKREATALLHIATARGDLGHLPAAEQSYQSAVDLLAALPADERTAWAWAGIAQVRGHAGRLAGAFEAAERALAAQAATKQGLIEGYLLLGRAHLARLAGNEPAFERDLAAALARATASDLPDLAARCSLERGLLDLESGRPAQAETALRAALGAPSAVGLGVPARAALGGLLCEDGRGPAGLALAREAQAAALAKSDQLFAQLQLAGCLARLGSASDARVAALRALDDAEASGMLWETAWAAATLLALPQHERPAAEGAVRARGRDALRQFLDAAPAELRSAAAQRPQAQWIRRTLDMLGTEYGDNRGRQG